MKVLPGTRGPRKATSLLLMCLIVVTAAADCPPPENKNNLILTEETILMSDFPDGSVATYECISGYIRESGSSTASCNNGKWTEPDLVCQKKDCGLPRPRPHMRFGIRDGTLYGAVINIICDKGYSIVGPGHAQCYHSGWKVITRCLVETCDKPGEVTNGRTSWDSLNDPQYGDVIEYSCNKGYNLTGNSSVMCSENGQYEPQPPECKLVTCETLKVTNGRTSWDSENQPQYGDVIQYFCNKGYKLMGNSSITCNENGHYEPQPPECTSDQNNFLVTQPQVSTATPTVHKDESVTTSAISSALRGSSDILTTWVKMTTNKLLSTSAPSLQEVPPKDVDSNKDTGYAPIIISVITVSIVVALIVFSLYKFLLKRKGFPKRTVPIC
ncbi:complement decay-accelerating factor isoform X2 [Thalassophryne amazonica]|uniref:complement decay-accelerating factor isoform X2 n=1 Tax=Thalassophryne amazonica TaxID=390379 RepID=UPI0014713ECA|nr:complement decay-accelerating factor isoform X2 [Thalassophryne amazonica]